MPAADRGRFGGGYDGELQYVDEQIGSLWENLSQQGLLRETLVVLTSDHGEGLREHGISLLRGRKLHVHAVAANCLFPYLDSVYTIAIPVGFALALTGNFLIVGPMTAAVLPISLTIALTMYVRQRAVFRVLGLRIRRNFLGFALYVLAYQLVMSPISVSGYATELIRARRVW